MLPRLSAMGKGKNIGGFVHAMQTKRRKGAHILCFFRDALKLSSHLASYRSELISVFMMQSKFPIESIRLVSFIQELFFKR